MVLYPVIRELGSQEKAQALRDALMGMEKELKADYFDGMYNLSTTPWHGTEIWGGACFPRGQTLDSLVPKFSNFTNF